MAAIITSIISGFFSLAVIWYQNHLQNKSGTTVRELTKFKAEELNKKAKPQNNIWRILFTLIIVACPLLLLVTLGKGRFGGDQYLAEYYLIWTIVTLIALLLGWKSKTLFEKIILIVSLIFLISMTIDVKIETNRNAQYRIDKMQPN